MAQDAIEFGKVLRFDFGNQIPGTVGRMQGTNFRDTAQRLDHRNGFLAGDLDQHDGADRVRVLGCGDPHGEAGDDALGSQPVDAVLHRAA